MDRYQKIDIAIKLSTLAISAILLFYGVSTYKEKSDRDFKKPFLSAQIEACLEITKLVAEVSRVKSIEGRAKFTDKLSTLYFSQGALFLNDEALAEFREFIQATEECSGKKEINECHHANLGGYQFNVARACRNELVKTWGSDPGSWVEELHDPLL